MEQKNDFLIVIKFLLKYKFQIIIVGLVAGLAAAIFSGPAFVTPLYDSQVIFYPSTTMSASKALVAEKGYSEDDFLSIGQDEEAEQLLQILQSDVVIDILKKKYNLMKHYNINMNKKYANTRFTKKFRKNFTSEMTKYMSIRIKVRDKDPQLAKIMTNDAAAIMDSLRNALLKDRANTGLAIVEHDYKEKIAYMKTLVDSLQSLGNLGVMKLEQQAEVLTKAYTDALLKGNIKALKEINERMKLVSKYGPVQESLAAELEFETEQLVDLRSRYKEIQIDATNDVPHIFYVEKAVVAERKAYPVRSLITLLSALGAVMFLIVILIIKDQLKKLNI